MSFAWTDRDGRTQELVSCQPILDEAEGISVEIDRMVVLLESADVATREAARRAIEPHQRRLQQLDADLVRWNVHADRMTRMAALELVEKIDGLPAAIAAAALVVALHEEHDASLAATAGAPQDRATMLAAPMTAIQARAINAVASRTPPPAAATRGAVMAWLSHQPKFARGRGDDGGWFGWSDRDGHAHRLVDPLQIERETVAIATELMALRGALADEKDTAALFALVEEGVARWKRIQILQYDLTRFDHEADARDLTECRRFAADWRTKRKTT